MGQFQASLKEAILYLPEHRAREKRSQELTLDQVLDQSRLVRTINPGTLDLILMAYRFMALFDRELLKFRSEALKPHYIKDLLAVAFGALMSRTQTPESVIVSESVEVAKEVFGQHTKGLVNAFLRQVTRDKAALLAELDATPGILLSRELQDRWAVKSDIIKRAAQQLRERPLPGIASFDSNTEFRLRAPDEIKNNDIAMQAMDEGSWLLCEWIFETVRARYPDAKSLQWLDACSAPGGKLIALSKLFSKGGINAKAVASDRSFARMETLKQNVVRWGLEDSIDPRMINWSVEPDPENPLGDFEFILADLPCSGSGTIHSRPDLLQVPIADRVEKLKVLQKSILDHLLTLSSPMMIVSICSVDPVESAFLEELLASKKRIVKRFSSWEQTSHCVEGLQAWCVE